MEPPTPPEPLPLARVTVVDIQVSFDTMVRFILKCAFAAIPALFVLGVLGFFLFSVFVASATR